MGCQLRNNMLQADGEYRCHEAAVDYIAIHHGYRCLLTGHAAAGLSRSRLYRRHGSI